MGALVRRSIHLTRQAIAAIVGFALFGGGWLTMALALRPGQGSATLWVVSSVARTLAVTWIFCFVWPALASYCASWRDAQHTDQPGFATLVMLEARLAARSRSSWLRMPSPAVFAALTLSVPVATIGAILSIGILVSVDTARVYATGNTAIALLDSVISGRASLADALASQMPLMDKLISRCASAPRRMSLT